MKFNRFYIIIPLVLIGGIFWLHEGIEEGKERAFISDKYFSHFNESFEGIVYRYEIESGIHLEMVSLRLTKSTIKYYDIRSNSQAYFCVIKNDSAEFITHEESIWKGDASVHLDMLKGDSIYFNGVVDSVYLFRNKKMLQAWKPEVGYTFCFRDIAAHHQL
jgi:hypothetical protein